jgi:hypothetical protein
MIEYPDSCLIERFTGVIDETTGEEVKTTLYNGECLLEITGQSRYDGFEFEHEPVLFLPTNNVMYKINDTVTVTTWNGRTISYTVKNWEAIKDNEFPELNDTCIWLKDGTE